MLSVGYRINGKVVIAFRKWATQTFRKHIPNGYTINKKQVLKNYEALLLSVENVKKLLPEGGQVKVEDALELVKMFDVSTFILYNICSYQLHI